MSDTPTDAEIDEVTLDVLGYAALDKETNETARMIARAVLAKWGIPQPVVREPLTTLTIAPVRRFLADRGIYLRDETTKELIVVAHGITQKGGG